MKHLILFGLLFLGFIACMKPEEVALKDGQQNALTRNASCIGYGHLSLSSSGPVRAIDNDIYTTNGWIADEIIQATDLAIIAVPDSDCDGVTDSLDVCPGINDKIDNNNDGKPDCKFPPTYAKVIPAWKCGTPTLQKVFVCFKTNTGGTITICTPYAAVNTHIAAGNRLGICGSAKCGSGN